MEVGTTAPQRAVTQAGATGAAGASPQNGTGAQNTGSGAGQSPGGNPQHNGQGTGEGSQTASHGAPAGTAQPTSNFRVSDHIGGYLAESDSPRMDDYYSDEHGGFNLANAKRYESARAHHDKVSEFRSELRNAISGNVIDLGGGQTVAFSDQGEVKRFFDMVGQVLSRPSAQQLLRLHFYESAMRMSTESAARQYESGVTRARAGGSTKQTPVSQTQSQQGFLGAPGTQQQPPPQSRGNGVPSTKELFKQNYPDAFNDVMNGRRGLFE